MWQSGAWTVTGLGDPEEVRGDRSPIAFLLCWKSSPHLAARFSRLTTTREANAR